MTNQISSPHPRAAARQQHRRQIVGFSLSPALAAEVKMEAARRGLSLRKLLEELWTIYKAKRAE